MKNKISIILGLILCASVLYAQGYKKIYVGGLHVEDNGQRKFSQEDLNREIYTSFENESFFRMTSLAKINQYKKNFISSTANTKSIENESVLRARKLLSVGKKMYHGLSFDKAQQSLSLSKKTFIQNLQYLRSNKDLLESHLYLGMTWMAQKKQKRAYNEFKKVVYLDPSFSMNPKQYSPKVIAVFNMAKKEVKNKMLSEVSIDAEKNMNVYINGRLMGETPLNLKLYTGDYFVLLEKEGYHTWYKLQKISRRSHQIQGENKAKIDNQRWAYMFRTREGKAQNSQEVQSVIAEAKRHGAEYILFNSLEKNINYRLMGQIYDVKNEIFSQVILANVESSLGDFPGAVDEMVQKFKQMIVGSQGKKDLKLGVGDFDKPKVIKPSAAGRNGKVWYKEWWIYPVAAAVVVGGVIASRQLGGGSGGTIIIDNN